MMDRGVPRGFAAFAGVALAAALACAMAALAYNPEQDQVNGKPVPALWQNNRITWSLNPTIGSNVDVTGGTNPVPVATAISNAFAAWQNAGLNGQSLASLSITRGADTTLSGPDPVDVTDCVNIVTFQDSNSSDFPAGTGIIAFTAITTSFGPPPTSYSCTSGGHTTQNTCTVASCLIDADMVFNPNEMFSTATPTESGHFDVQAIATHESGHFLGLDHSGIAHAIMYPYGDAGGNGSLRTLAVDDVAGICFLYPNVNAGTLSGNLSGTVTQGGPAFWLHTW